ncbi:MAG: ABC transporter ATP-binding protein [Candidimonas sp.]|nr:MAG: ABC transporter ATP-binding protein [Candidimonas sp.]
MTTAASDVVFQCTAVSSGYGDMTIIRGIDMEVRRGEIVTILGKNGMGKTTLMKTIMGFLPPSSGSIVLFGEDVTGRDPQLLVERGVAYVPQEEAIFQDLTVEDNLRLGMRSDRHFKQGISRIEPWFPVMVKRLRQKAGTLSGGEQKMLLMSRALVSDAKFLLIDEISEGLQPSMVVKIAEVLKGLAKEQGVSMFMAEQNIGLVDRLSDRVALINTGTITERRDLSDDGRGGHQLTELMRL